MQQKKKTVDHYLWSTDAKILNKSVANQIH
jgi:hypothetical protein